MNLAQPASADEQQEANAKILADWKAELAEIDPELRAAYDAIEVSA